MLGRMIVKVQRPVIKGGVPHDGPDIMVYGEGHAHQQLVDFEALPTWLIVLLEKSPKVFAHAVWSWKRGGHWEFTGPADWQSW